MNIMHLFFSQLLSPGPNIPRTPANQSTLNTIMAEVYIAIGAIGLIFMLIAGLRYITSQGDPAKIAQAKNMVIYTFIGTVIAALAWSITSYVLRQT
jgi:hypothetical protein